MIKETLLSLGLNDKEIEAYLAIINLGTTTASVIAQRIKIPRSTTHYICQQLADRGLVNIVEKNNSFLFTPEPPEKFLQLIDDEERELNEKRDQMNRILGDLKGMMNPYCVLPKVKFLSGKDGFITLCEESLRCEGKEILFATSMDKFRDIVTDKYDTEHYIPTRLKNKISLKLLCPKTKLTEQMKENDADRMRETRFLPDEFSIDNTIFIFDDVTALVSNVDYPTCVLISSKEITKMLRTFYSFMWHHAQK